MADINKRLHYFNGQFLEEKDFTDEQEYHLDRERRHNRLLHTYGVAEGLNVTAAAGSGEVSVSPGTALDGQGRLIVLEQSRTLTLAGFSKDTVYLVISYDEIGVDPATVGNQGQPTRWEERPKVELVDSGSAPPSDTHIRLAKIGVNSGGTVSTLDLSERQLAGVRVGGELTIPRLRLSNPNFDESLWPNVTSENQQEVTVTGDLKVTGRLYSDDLFTHIKDSSNPHGTTAAQTGALTSVGGVTNPGGNVNIISGTGILVTPDNNTKRITIAGSSILGVSNPGGDIGIVGSGGINVTSDNSSAKRITIAGSTIQGVSNPGGDIGIVGASGITITPDNTAGNKRITISGGAPTNIGGITAPGATVNIVGGTNVSVTADNTSTKRITIASSSIGGVSNPGGNIGIVGSGVTITPDNGAAKQITISATPASIGALPAIDYDIANRNFATVSFTNADANNATKTVNLSYQPRIIFATASLAVFMNNTYWSGVSTGFAEVENGISQTCMGTYFNKPTTTGQVQLTPNQVGSAIAANAWTDVTSGGNFNLGLSIVVLSVSSSGLVLQWQRTTSAGYSPFTTFNATVVLYCMGNAG